jgi:DNA-binding transcriptional regulator YiaG
MTARKKAKAKAKAEPASVKPAGMTGEQFYRILTKLGFSQSSFSRAIQVNDRTVRSWVSGQFAVPTVVAMLLNLMVDTKSTAEDLKP